MAARKKKAGEFAAVISNARLMAGELADHADNIADREGAEADGGSFTKSMALGMAFIASCPSNSKAKALFRELLDGWEDA